MLYNTQVALDITNLDIRLVASQGGKIRQWMSSPIPPGLIKDGVIQDPQAMGVILDTLFRSLNLQKKGIVCTVTGLPFIFRTINMPGPKHKVKAEAIERAARMEMSVAEGDMYLVWKPVEIRAEGAETDYFVVGVPKNALNPFLDTLSRARIKITRLEIKPLALARAASSKSALIVSLEKEYFDIVLVNEGLVRVIHSFGNAIKQSDVIGLVNELVDGLNIAIKSFNRDFPKSDLPADIPILAAGYLAANDAVLQMVAEATGHPVEVLAPALAAPPNLPAELYAASLGLIASPVLDRGYRDIGVNLLEGIKKRKMWSVQPVHLMATAGAIILLVVLARITGLRSEARENVISLEQTVTAEARNLGEVQQSVKEAEAQRKLEDDGYQSLQAQLKKVQLKNRNIVDLKEDYASSLTFITGSLPENMYFTSITLDQTSITIEGTAQDSLDIIGLTDILDKNNEFAGTRVKSIEPREEGGVVFQVVVNKKV
jgi:hypothetical protein